VLVNMVVYVSAVMRITGQFRALRALPLEVYRPNFRVEELVRFGIMDAKGIVFHHDRAGRIAHTVRIDRGEPLHPASTAGWD
jgi:hypothetical protein